MEISLRKVEIVVREYREPWKGGKCGCRSWPQDPRTDGSVPRSRRAKERTWKDADLALITQFPCMDLMTHRNLLIIDIF